MAHNFGLLAMMVIVFAGCSDRVPSTATAPQTGQPLVSDSSKPTNSVSATLSDAVPESTSADTSQIEVDTLKLDQDSRSIEDLESQRFGQLSDETVQRECDDWVTRNDWRFGQTLSQLRLTGSGVTADDMRALFLKLRQQEASQYTKLTKDVEPIRSAGAELLETWAQFPMDGSDPEYLVRLGQRAQQVVAAGSNDPLVRTMAACYAPSDDYSTATATLSKLRGELTEAGYGSSFQFVLQRNRLTLANQRNPADHEAFAADLIEATLSFVDDVSHVRDATPLTWYYLQGVYNLFTETERLSLYRRLLLSDNVDPFFLHMTAAIESNQTAWRIRGQGFADSVSDEASQQFASLNSKASLHFRKAWLLYPDLPDAPAAMIAIANAASGSEAWTPRQWFELSSRARFDYALSYNSYMYPLLPRWGGSHAAMLNFGKECAETKAFETQVPYFLIDFISQIAEETPNGMTWEDPEYVSVLLDFWEAIDDWSNENKIAKVGDRWQNQFSLQAAVLIRNGRYAEAKNVLDQASFPPAFGPMQKVLNDPALATSMPYALSEPDAMPLLDIEERFGRTFAPDTAVAEFSTAIEVIAAARQKTATPKAERYLSVREDSLRKQKAFQEGQWVELGFDDPLTTWHIRNGTATVEGPTTLRISNLAVGLLPVQAIPNAAFPPPYTIKAKVERIRGNDSFEFVGINVGPISQATMLGAPGGVAFVLGDMPRVAGSYVPGSRQVERFPIENLEDQAELEVNIWPTTYQMIVNGETLPLNPIRNFRPNSEFAIGGNPHENDRGDIRVSDVKIRKLADPAPAQEGEDSEVK